MAKAKITMEVDIPDLDASDSEDCGMVHMNLYQLLNHHLRCGPIKDGMDTIVAKDELYKDNPAMYEAIKAKDDEHIVQTAQMMETMKISFE